MAVSYTTTEQEAITLLAIWERIDSMVNYEMFDKLTKVDDVQLTFASRTHQALFNILLVDLLSQPRNWPFGLGLPPPGAPESERSLLFHLGRICDEPILNPKGDDLRLPLQAFVQWLETDCVVEKVWLPSIETEIDIKVKRISFIKICGNISKHSFTRLSANVGEICKILAANGKQVDPDQGYLVLPEFYEWFHNNIFSYHSSAIAEFLNNIRWGIYEYLQLEFSRSFTRDDPGSIAYRYKIPSECRSPAGQSMYWDLMNSVRSRPYLPRFEVTRYLKMRY